MKLKSKFLVMIMINILLLKNLNKLTADKFTARLVQAKLATKANIADLVKRHMINDDKVKYLNRKVASNKTKHVLIENKFDELSKTLK